MLKTEITNRGETLVIFFMGNRSCFEDNKLVVLRLFVQFGKIPFLLAILLTILFLSYILFQKHIIARHQFHWPDEPVISICICLLFQCDIDPFKVRTDAIQMFELL